MDSQHTCSNKSSPVLSLTSTNDTKPDVNEKSDNVKEKESGNVESNQSETSEKPEETPIPTFPDVGKTTEDPEQINLKKDTTPVVSLSPSDHGDSDLSGKSAEKILTDPSPEVSIPSLDLKSLNKSNSEIEKSYSSQNSPTSLPIEKFEEESVNDDDEADKFSASHMEGSGDKLINNNDRSEHISNESSIHTQFDWSENSESLKNTTPSGSFNEPGEKPAYVNLHQIKTSPKSDNSTSKSLSDGRMKVNKIVIVSPRKKNKNSNRDSSSSEEIIKLDIRGQATKNWNTGSVFIPGFDIATTVKGYDCIALNEKVVALASMESPFFAAQKFQLPFNKNTAASRDADLNNEEDVYEQDCGSEEMILNESRDKFPIKEKGDVVHGKADVDSSLSTVTTEYKTLCEDFKHKIPELQSVLKERDVIIEDLKEQTNQLQLCNEHLTSEVGNLQQLLSDATSSGVEIKGHLSDFVKHELMIRDDAEDLPVTVKLYEESHLQPKQIQNRCFVASGTQTDSLPCKKQTSESDDLNLKLSNFYKEFDKIGSLIDPSVESKFVEIKIALFNTLEDELQEIQESLLSNANDSYVRKLAAEKSVHSAELARLKDLVLNMKSDNPDITKLRQEMEAKHKSEMENLRTYFERKCEDMKNHYSEEVYSQHSKKMSNGSSTDSLNNCPEDLPFGSPLHEPRAKVNYESNEPAVELNADGLIELSGVDESIRNIKSEHWSHIEKLTSKHEAYIKELISSHEVQINEMEEAYKEQIAVLKAHLQTLENTEINSELFNFAHRDTDLELEKALLSGPHSELTGCPPQLMTLKDKSEGGLCCARLNAAHAEELAGMRSENAKQIALLNEKHKQESDKWKQKRNEAFDKNRHLEEAMRERDGLKNMTCTLRKVLSQLVEYFNLCEEELNNTFVGELLKQILVADENFDNTLVLSSTDRNLNKSFNDSEHYAPNESAISDMEISTKRMHFAPNVNGIMTYIDSSSTIDCLDQSQDVSINFKHDLDSCLKRLRMEAQELLILSKRNVPKRLSILGPDDVIKEDIISEKLTELNDENKLEKMDDNKWHEKYQQSEMERKNLEESLAQSICQEVLLRKELQEAMDKISELMSDNFLDTTKEIVSEGYGVMNLPRTPISLVPPSRIIVESPPPLPLVEGGPSEGGRSLSLDGCAEDRRAPALQERITRLTRELEVATREKEDMHMQLESCNKQLRSIRQFLEEQSTEREQERDEFQRKLDQLKDENAKLSLKTQHHVRICKEVESLETQMRDMSSLIANLETQKNTAELNLVTSVEKVGMLRDIIVNLETQLEGKVSKETEILEQLNNLKVLAEERELKTRDLSEQLEQLKSEMEDKVADEILAAGAMKSKGNYQGDLEAERKLVDQMRHKLHTLVETIAEHTTALENLHEAVCSQSCSSPSEDVSIKDHKKGEEKQGSAPLLQVSPSKLILQLPVLEMSQLDDSLHRHLRAEDAAVKRIRDLEMQLVQLKDVAQELRAERDCLQERVFEQNSKISSMQSRLEQTRHTAEAMRQQGAEAVRLQLEEALAEAQLLKEALLSRDRQVQRLKELVESTKKRLGDQEQELSLCTGSSKETIQRLKRELRDQQSKIRELQEALDSNRLNNDPALLETVVADKNNDIQILKQQLLEKERYLQAIMSFKLDDNLKQISDSDKDQNNDGKHSARTLSDILSISEFDEPDLVMRRAEVKQQSCLSGQLGISANQTKDPDFTLPPETNPALMAASSGLQITQIDEEPFDEDDFNNQTSPKMDNFLSPEEIVYKRNVNETAEIGIPRSQEASHTDKEKKPATDLLVDDCSMFPNKDCSSDKSNSIAPKRINFSNAPNDASGKKDDKSVREKSVSLKSLEELGIHLDWKQEKYPDILTQLKEEIIKIANDLEDKKNALNLAEQELAGLPSVKKEMDDLKSALQKSLQKMEEDKIFYSEQLEKFSSGERMLKQKLEKSILDLNEQTKEFQILKEDIVRRENIVMELAKEKRNLQQAHSDMEQKCKIMEQNQKMLEGSSEENMHLREKLSELNKLEQLISEKNLQIDNLNENLNRLDDLQRNVSDREELIEKLKEEHRNSEDVLKSQNSELKLNVKKMSEVNLNMQNEITTYKDSLSKLEKEFESVLSGKDTQGEHHFDEISRLEEFKLLLSELDSPRSLNDDQIQDVQVSHERRKLDKIRRQISGLQTELNLKKTELNAKVLELEEVKSELSDLKTQFENLTSYTSEKESAYNQLKQEKDSLQSQLKYVMDKIREEGNTEEIREKLSRKIDECTELEHNVAILRDVIERNKRDVQSDRDRDTHLQDLSVENGRLKQRLCTCEGRLLEQEGLIQELHSVRESLITDLQTLEQKSEEELDTSARLQLLLDTEKQMANNLQCQDSNVIQILRGRLEVALDSESELQMLLDREKLNSEQLTKQIDLLKKQLEHMRDASHADKSQPPSGADLQQKLESTTAQLEDQMEICELLKSESLLLKTKFEREKSRLVDLQNVLDREKLWFQKEIEASKDQNKALKFELAELKRQKHEMHLELVHSTEKIHLHKNEMASVEKKLMALKDTHRDLQRSESNKMIMSELESQNANLIMEVDSLKHKLEMATERESRLQALLGSDGKLSAGSNSDLTTVHHLKEMQSLLRRHITENVQMSETVRELTQERRELQARVKYLENQIKMGGKHSQSMMILPEGVDQQVRFLYGRYIRVDSYRKALLWQKRYLMGVAAALDDWRIRLGDPGRPLRSTGLQRFKCVVLSIKAIFRMKYLVKRWHTGTRLAANIHLNIPNVYPTELRTSKSYTHMPTSLPSKHDLHMRHSLTNPSSGYHIPLVKDSNKSWSHSSMSNLPQAAGRHATATRHPATLSTRQGQYRLEREGPDHWQNSARLREVQSDAHQGQCEDSYPMRSSTSDQEASPTMSRYMNRLDQLNMSKLHRTLNSPRDPP